MLANNKQLNIFVLLSIFFLLFALSVKAIGGSNLKITITPAPQCADGVDNDGDELIDYPNDPECESPSDNLEAVYVAPIAPPAPNSGGGGGGGGLVITPSTTASFSGKAYPNTIVKLLRDGEIVASTISGSDANFQMAIQGLTPGNHLFSIYSEDSASRHSVTLPFNIYVAQGAIVQLSGVFIPPTVDINKTKFLPGEVINIFGQTIPESQVSITVHSADEMFLKTDSNKNGLYSYSLDSSLLAEGPHEAKIRASKNGEVSDYSSPLNFQVLDKNQVPEKTEEAAPDTPNNYREKADFNKDNKVNLVDFSIAAFWYKKSVLSEAAKMVDLNSDSKIDLVDFSILAYYWTG